MLGKDKSTIYERLSVLVEQGYLVKLYDKSYHLRQRPAIYYLAPLGIRHLKHIGTQRTQLHYKNKHFTDEQIDEQLLLTRVARAACTPYEDSFSLYTKYQLAQNDLYLTPLPYAKLQGNTDAIPDYFIEYFPAFYPTWKLRKRINQHIAYADEHDKYIYPHLLLIAGNHSTEKRVIRMTQDTYADFEIFATTQERLFSGKPNVWLKPEDFDEHEEPAYRALPTTFEK